MTAQIRKFISIYFCILVVSTIALHFLCISYFNLEPLMAYLCAINISVFVFFGYDKIISGSRQVRVPEKLTFLGALAGGSAGLLLGIRLFRHKTRKTSFQWVLALILVAQICLLRYALGRL